MMKRVTFYILALSCLFFAAESFAVYTVTSGHPRIWIQQSDLSTLRSRVDTGGNHETLYGTITSWCDTHISDTLDSNTDYDEHLTKYAIAHILDPEGNDTTYGDRVVTILDHLADNAQGYSSHDYNESTDRSASDDKKWWEVAASLGVAYDWAYSRIDGSAAESDIEAYLHSILETDCCSGGWSGNGCSSYQQDTATTHKTEENWGYITLALAISGEQGSTPNAQVSTLLDRAEEYLVTATDDYSGAYVREHNHAREDGHFIVTDGYESDIANSMTYIAAWHTGTDDDLTLYPWWCNNARGLLALLPPDGKFPKIGEVQPYGTTSSLGAQTRGTGSIFYLAGAYYYGSDDSESSGLWDAIEDINSSRANDDWVDIAKLIWTTGAEDFTGLDRAYHFDRMGGFAFRSGWDFTSSVDIVGEVRGFKMHCIGHYAESPGHLDLRRGSDYLLVKGGAYTGSSWNDDTSDEYDQDSDSANTVHIDDTDHRHTVNSSSCSKIDHDEDEFGQTTRFQYSDGNYVYGLYDLTNAIETADVNHTSGHVKRSVVFMDDKWVIVHDSISKVTAADSVRILWHMDNEPADDGTGWTDSGQTASETGASSSDGSAFWWTTGASKAYVRVIEPTTGFTLVKRGGSWDTAFVDIDGTTHTVSSYTYDHWGQWIAETKIANPATTDLDFLHVIQPVASASSEETTERLTGTGYIGVCVRATTRAAALFSEDGSDKTGVTFSVADTTGTLKAVVANLAVGTYTVNGSGSYPVDVDGVLYFSADLSTANSFTVSTSQPQFTGIGGSSGLNIE